MTSTPRQYPGATPAQWLEGARPHTWANAVAPVLAGTAAATLAGEANPLRAVLAGVVALAMIVGVNYANDYSDGIKGTDDDRSYAEGGKCRVLDPLRLHEATAG